MPRREPPRVCEALSPHRRSYLYGRQSFRDSADSLYRALLTKNRKLLGWLPRPFTRATAHVHDVHPCFHVPQSSRFITTDSTYQRPLATVRIERRIPNSCRIPPRCALPGSGSPIRDVRRMSPDKNKKKDKSELLVSLILCHTKLDSAAKSQLNLIRVRCVWGCFQNVDIFLAF